MYLLAALAAALLVGPLAVTIHPASAQMSTQQQSVQQDTNTRLLGQRTLNGTVNLRGDVKNYLQTNMKVTLTDTVAAAKKIDPNRKVFAARIAAIQGNVVYRVVLANLDTRTISVAVIDAGNGKVLVSPQIALRSLWLLMHARTAGGVLGGQMG